MKYSKARRITQIVGFIVGVLALLMVLLGKDTPVFWVLLVPTAILSVIYFLVKFKYCRCPNCGEMVTGKTDRCPSCKAPME